MAHYCLACASEKGYTVTTSRKSYVKRICDWCGKKTMTLPDYLYDTDTTDIN